MNALVTEQVRGLAGTLVTLKKNLRAALASELAEAIGSAVRDVLVVALLDRLAIPPRTTARPMTPPPPGAWREDYDDGWGEPRDPWADPDEPGIIARPLARDADDSDEKVGVPAAAAVAVGLTVGRWWLARRGSAAVAVGAGTLVAVLGLAGGPLARAVLAVMAATADVLTAEAALASTARVA